MKSILLSIVVVTTLVAAGVGGTFAGFVDTEISEDNFVQAGISDLLVNGLNDPDVPAKIQYTHAAPCKSIDFWVDLYNWGVCQGGTTYMHILNVDSHEAGTKLHMGGNYVYDGVATGNWSGGVPEGYRIATGVEPIGPNVWSSEPEKISEVGDGMVGQYYISDNHSCLLGEDYGSGISDNLDVVVTVPLVGAVGNILGNPDTNDDGEVDSTERTAWGVANRWQIVSGLSGNLTDVECNKTSLGFLITQTKTFVHIDVHLQQIECPGWPDDQTKYWPTNALQGDIATWDMLFELNTD